MDGYSTDMLCTYLNIDIEDYLQEELYRNQMLQIYNLYNWNDEIINLKTEKLYFTLVEIFKSNKNNIFLQKYNLTNILIKLKSTYSLQFIILICGSDDLTIFKLLFKYELYQYAHAYFCYILNSYNNKDNTTTNIDLIEKAYNRLYNNIK